MTNEISNPIGTEDGSGMQGSRVSNGMNEKIWAYIQASTAKGEVQVISYDGDEATAVKCADAATLAVYQEVGIVLEAHTSAEYGWVQVKGKCEALVEGTTDVAKDDYLEVLNGEVSLKKDGSARTVNSIAIACEAQASNEDVLTDVILLGGRVIIAAS